jgi:hypothetical protein
MKKKILFTNNSHILITKYGGYSKQLFYLFNIFKEFGYEIYHLFYAFKIDSNDDHTKLYSYFDLKSLYERCNFSSDVEVLDDEMLKEISYFSIQNEGNIVDINLINEIIDKYKIDMFFCLGDAFVFGYNKINSQIIVPSYYWYPCHYFPLCKLDINGMNCFSNILSLSPSIKYELEKIFPYKQIYYLPHIVEKVHIYKSKAEIREKWNISMDKKIILIIAQLGDGGTVYSITNRKAIDVHLIAFQQLNEKYRDTHLFLHTLANKFTPDYPLETLLNQLKLSNENFTWSKEKLQELELHELYKMSDIYVCCSKAEGFGVPILEAQHYDLDVITNNFLSMSEHNFQNNTIMPSTKERHYHLDSDWIMTSSDNLFNKLEEVYLHRNEQKIKKSNWISENLTDYKNIKQKLYNILNNDMFNK